MTYNFDRFDTAIDFADGIALGQSMHDRASTLAAFATVHSYGEYTKGNAYSIERKLNGDDYSVSYLVIINA